MKIYETLLLFALVCALAAFFVMWAKLEEEKVKTREEREKRWDEISRALSIEKELENAKSKYEQVVYMWRDIAEEKVECEIQRDSLQDKLSDLLCPSNNHIWKNGRCVKCGRGWSDG